MPRDLPVSDLELRRRITPEEKKARVLAEGTSIEYVVCPLCGLNRVLDKHSKGRVRWDRVDPEQALILQVRYGGGWSSGFHLEEERSMTLDMMASDPRYRGIVKAIRDQAARLLAHIEDVL